MASPAVLATCQDYLFLAPYEFTDWDSILRITKQYAFLPHRPPALIHEVSGHFLLHPRRLDMGAMTGFRD